jgi:hypothetical protein
MNPITKESTYMANCHDEAVVDTKRDAAALFRAIIGGDYHAASILVTNTRCRGCLAVQAVILGIILAVPDAEFLSISDDGHVHIGTEHREELDQVLTAVLDGLND